MRQSAIARVLVDANKDGEAYTLTIGLRGLESSIQDARVVEYWGSENVLVIQTNYDDRVYVDGDHIDLLKVNK